MESLDQFVKNNSILRNNSIEAAHTDTRRFSFDDSNVCFTGHCPLNFNVFFRLTFRVRTGYQVWEGGITYIIIGTSVGRSSQSTFGQPTSNDVSGH